MKTHTTLKNWHRSLSIDDDEHALSNPNSVGDKLGKDLNNTSDQMKGVRIDQRENLRVLDNDPASFRYVEDIVNGLEANSKNVAPTLMESSKNSASRRPVSLEDFFNYVDDVIEPESNKQPQANQGRGEWGGFWNG